MRHWRVWIPAPLPGATLAGWLSAALGAFIGIATTGAITATVLGGDWRIPFLMVPLAASSVILFALPASPLARPWAIVMGHVSSAVVGVWVAQTVPNLTLAAGLAVTLSILAMAATRSLHPPGGSTALLAVLGGPAVSSTGYAYALAPVGLNALLLVLLGTLYHRLWTRHPYPHAVLSASPEPPESEKGLGIRSEDIDAAVVRLGETLDIAREDVETLVREVERRVLERTRAENRGP